MKTILSTITLIFCSSITFAQTPTPVGLAAKSNLDGLQKGGLFVRYDNRYEGTKGSPFLFDEYTKAKILLDTKSMFEGIDMKYNVYENNFLYLTEDGTPLVVDGLYVDYIELVHPVLKTTYKLKKFEGVGAADSKEAQRLYLFLHDGEVIKLALLPTKELVKANFKGDTYGADRTYDEFVDRKSYCFKGKDGVIVKVKLNKKHLLASLADKESEVKSFISKEKIDASTEAGWVKVLAYYEKL